MPEPYAANLVIRPEYPVFGPRLGDGFNTPLAELGTAEVTQTPVPKKE